MKGFQIDLRSVQSRIGSSVDNQKRSEIDHLDMWSRIGSNFRSMYLFSTPLWVMNQLTRWSFCTNVDTPRNQYKKPTWDRFVIDLNWLEPKCTKCERPPKLFVRFLKIDQMRFMLRTLWYNTENTMHYNHYDKIREGSKSVRPLQAHTR